MAAVLVAVAPLAVGKTMKQHSLKRWWRHLNMTRWQFRRAFPAAALQAIGDAVRASESGHGGEIRVAIEADWPSPALLSGLTPRQRALEVFASLSVWDTRARNGVLIYLCLADRDVEIVADRGLSTHVSDAEWAAVCEQLERDCAAGRYGEGMCAAVRTVGALIGRHYAVTDRNELSDAPAVL